ncbi:MAG: insulinase family protein [Muribaculaceae bacterium]|nr:insulinase family protein [Muribaculaceae bacterium]
MIETTRFELANGLRFVHNYDGNTAMVAVNVLYNVGARDESPELTGLAHLFEHLMFGGSVNIPDFDGAIERAGGKNNAWTSNDFTNFYDIVPAHNVETAFWLESDRMLSPSFSERSLEVQRSVVIEEFKQQCLNRPYGNMMHHLRGMVYTVHPYSWPVIGKTLEHIASVTRDDEKAFFFSHYAPDNAVIAVSGNITAEETRRLAEKWFGDIPRRDIAPRSYAAEPVQTAARFAEVSGHVPATDITIAYPMEGYGTKQYYCADLLTDLMANGESSIFYRELLMESDLFTSVDASILGSEEPGMLMLNMRLRENGADNERRAIEAVNAKVEDIINRDFTQEHLTRAINRMESAMMFNNVSYLAKAQALAMCEYHGEDINGMIARYRDLSAADLRAAGREIFRPERANTLIYRPV